VNLACRQKKLDSCLKTFEHATEWWTAGAPCLQVDGQKDNKRMYHVYYV
jgi:hypothetical protein